MSSLTYNLQILSKLIELVNEYPELRFSQILYNYKFVIDSETSSKYGEDEWKNEFNLESKKLLERITKEN